MTEEKKISEPEAAKPSVKVVKKPSSAPKRKAPEKKVKQVKKLAEDMKNAATIMIISIKGVPSPQLQKIKKDLRGKAEVNVIKKNILVRAIDEAGIPEMEGLKEHIQADSALGLSNDDAFELAALLSKNRNPIAAKQGQTADEDIMIEAGPTSLMPGPDISALGAVGLKVAVEEGKIAIKNSHVVLKAGDKVSADIAAVLQKLDIKPFMIGLNPAVIYDSKNKKIYVGVKIDPDQALEDLLTGRNKALGFAQKLNIITKDTIGYLLAKANSEMKKLQELAPAEPEKAAEESKEEPKAEEEEEEEKEEAKPADTENGTSEDKKEGEEEPKTETKTDNVENKSKEEQK